MADCAISTCLLAELTPEAAYEEYAAAGFRRLELDCGDNVAGRWHQDTTGTLRAMRRHGLHADSVHSNSKGWGLGSPVEEMRRVAIEVSTACFAPAVEVGAGVIVVHPNKPNAEHPCTEADYSASIARTRESLAVLAERAGTMGLRLALENMPARGTPRPGRAVDDLIEMIDGLGDHVGILIDVGHSNANGLNPAEEVRAFGRRVFAVHLQDNDGKGNDQHLVPGEGTVPWDELLDALDECAPNCRRVLEVVAKETDPHDVLRATARVCDAWRRR